MNNRTIKFRAWDKTKERMILVEDIDFITERINQSHNLPGITMDFKSIELMQFTGHLDKNGKEIWEGDIVRGSSLEDTPIDEMQVGEVAWFDFRWEIVGIDTDGEFSDFQEWCEVKNIEVIGNIYENPELLK